jgi:hypothetical protein
MPCSFEGASRFTSSVLLFSVGVNLRWEGDDILNLCCVLLVQLRDHVIKFHSLIANTSQIELRFCLCELHGWPFCPKWWEPSGELPVSYISHRGHELWVSMSVCRNNHVNVAKPLQGLVLQASTGRALAMTGRLLLRS